MPSPPSSDRTRSEAERLQRWAFLHALVALATLAGILAASTTLFFLIACAPMAELVRRFRGHWTPAGAFGAANTITAFRLAGVVLLTVAGVHMPALALLAVVIAILVCDGLDGAVARRRNEASAFGEFFDKETDALLLLLLCVLLVFTGRLGLWILTLGLMRYIYVIVAFLAKPQVRKEQRSRFGRYVYVLTVSALLLAFLPLPNLYVPVALGATALLTLSFARSFWMLFAAA